MKVVLLAAGLGTRLRPLTLTTPKCLVPIHGKPLLDYWLELLLCHSSIDKIFINTHYKHEQVRSHIAGKWASQKRISLWHETHLLGTAGTLLSNAQQLGDDDIMLIHADNLSSFNLGMFIDSYVNRDAAIEMSMMLFKTDAPTSCGIVELDANGRVVAMHEKVQNPPGNLANGAVYILSRNILKHIEKSRCSDFSNEVIPHFLGHIQGWENTNYHRDIGSPESYRLAEKEFNHKVVI